ncbi:four-carbon acid sugar kinase family protein [Streptomyces bathyalis]|uniref:Four-carbon acid sugar kinase family protein n=1 Tax=Streptomyces bathyalis TaxID=2710756 RepID=A0A7T1TB29_9ACTN|nr:four-carbon acid sugar kinase family protein [Streptomyces bathyalis]
MSTAPAVVIVADDLSGVADSAAALAPHATTAVALRAEEDRPDADVVAVDTDSRRLPASDAAAVCAAVARRAAPVLERPWTLITDAVASREQLAPFQEDPLCTVQVAPGRGADLGRHPPGHGRTRRRLGPRTWDSRNSGAQDPSFPANASRPVSSAESAHSRDASFGSVAYSRTPEAEPGAVTDVWSEGAYGAMSQSSQ